MQDALAEAIARVAAGPASATADGVTVTEQKLADLIKAHQYLATVAVGSPFGALGIRRIVSRGPNG